MYENGEEEDCRRWAIEYRNKALGVERMLDILDDKKEMNEWLK